MNRKNLIELMAAAAATTALCGCASVPTPQHTADTRQDRVGDLGVTRKAWTECVRAAIPGVDDPHSSSAVVARAAMKGCSNEYSAMVRSETHTLAPTCGANADCTRDALAKAEREATRAATEEVVNARVHVAGAQVLKCQ
jgi:hypothetical protein